MSLTYPPTLEIRPLEREPTATIRVPGSKSITNRALVLAAMCCRGWDRVLGNVLDSEDTQLMTKALMQLGFQLFSEPILGGVRVGSQGSRPIVRPIPAERATLFLGNSGTTMRFLTALVSLGPGRYRLDGVARMRERPIGDLLDALGQLGVNAYSETGNGCPPVVVESNGWQTQHVRVKGDVSSQFLSGLLLAAPFAPREVTIEVEGGLVSEPYVAMTVEMMRQWNLSVEVPAPGVYRIPAPQWQISAVTGRPYLIEPDASAASYFLAAAAIAGGRVTVPGLGRDSLQGDIRFADLLARMGCRVAWTRDGVTALSGPLTGITADMNEISDTVMTLGAVACFARGATRIRNVAHIRHKETDRIAALATELRRLGAKVDERPDGLKITPGPLHGATVQTYNDHRMAMSLALIGLKTPGVVIDNPACVAKTYPEFFTDLEKLR